ncbi:Uncharacterised protein [Mycobacteroides abscessus subsp. abscessus]|nr:Uncharacterised protein [Mycobacteroides abscessus subsp. abscessus]
MDRKRSGDIAIDDGLGELLEPVMRHVVVGEAQRDGVGSGEGCTRECGVQAELAGGARE